MKMSATSANDDENVTMCCASCGIAEIDDMKLKDCDDCDLVKYCSDQCKEDHRPQHEEACMERAAELHDELLFKQPESSHMGDCPICCLPLSLDELKSTTTACCGKRTCDGCDVAIQQRVAEGSDPTCPFCRHPVPESDEELENLLMKRFEANDVFALSRVAARRYEERDLEVAIKYWAKAAELGHIESHYQLSCMYANGEGVEEDWKKQMYHLEKAAIGGDPIARHNLGCIEFDTGVILGESVVNKRAIKHWIIAANLGYEKSLETLTHLYREGLNVSKDEFAGALRGYQAAIEATKSPQREEATKFKEFLATEFGWKDGAPPRC